MFRQFRSPLRYRSFASATLVRHRSCQFTSNHRYRHRAICGPPAIGQVARTATSGFQALGCSRRPLVYFGRRVIGAGVTASTHGGPHIGFYGGVNYGFGYVGVGYEGGHWENGAFAYNRTVNNFGSVAITNVYEKTVVVEPGASRVSFNGGSGGTTARPTLEEEAAARERHVAAAPAQFQHERNASSDKSLLASENHGRPAVAATSRPGEFTGKGVVAAREEKPATVPPGSKAGGAETVAPNANIPTPRDKRRRLARRWRNPAAERHPRRRIRKSSPRKRSRLSQRSRRA